MEIMSTHQVMTIKGRNELKIPSTEPESVLLLLKYKIRLKYFKIPTIDNDCVSTMEAFFTCLLLILFFPNFYVEHIHSTTVRNK